MAPPTRVFFVADLHGSERCFRKFLNAGRVYKAGVLLIGGDIAGKTITPLWRENGGWVGQYFGERRHVETETELERFEAELRDLGSLPYRTTPGEWADLSAHRSRLDDLFQSLALESLAAWVRLAESRLQGSGIRTLVGLGNDDFDGMEAVVRASDYVELTDDAVLRVDDRHELLTLAYSNPTPWHTHRELSEEAIARRIDALAAKLSDTTRAVFNCHVPPLNTPLDLAPRLTADLTKVMGPGGDEELVHVGSSAVRAAIERYQPLAGLHGHIHESRGVGAVGRTAVYNPGSSYSEGILLGLVVDFEPDRIRSHVLTTG